MKSLKRIILFCMLLLSVTVLSACAQANVPDDAMTLAESGAYYVMNIMSLDDASLDEAIDQYVVEQNVVMQNGLNSWKDSREELGDLSSIGMPEVEELSDGGVRITFISEFENRDCEIIVALDKRRQNITELTFNPVYSLGEKLSQALVNLVVGMGTVFAVLIFLTWIISLFKHVNGLFGKKIKEAAPVPAAPAVEIPSEEASDDEELAAVIAAAVAAYESETGNGSVMEKKPALENGIRVRSYRR